MDASGSIAGYGPGVAGFTTNANWTSSFVRTVALKLLSCRAKRTLPGSRDAPRFASGPDSTGTAISGSAEVSRPFVAEKTVSSSMANQRSGCIALVTEGCSESAERTFSKE